MGRRAGRLAATHSRRWRWRPPARRPRAARGAREQARAPPERRVPHERAEERDVVGAAHALPWAACRSAKPDRPIDGRQSNGLTVRRDFYNRACQTSAPLSPQKCAGGGAGPSSNGDRREVVRARPADTDTASASTGPMKETGLDYAVERDTPAHLRHSALVIAVGLSASACGARSGLDDDAPIRDPVDGSFGVNAPGNRRSGNTAASRRSTPRPTPEPRGRTRADRWAPRPALRRSSRFGRARRPPRSASTTSSPKTVGSAAAHCQARRSVRVRARTPPGSRTRRARTSQRGRRGV